MRERKKGARKKMAPVLYASPPPPSQRVTKQREREGTSPFCEIFFFF